MRAVEGESRSCSRGRRPFEWWRRAAAAGERQVEEEARVAGLGFEAGHQQVFVLRSGCGCRRDATAAAAVVEA